MAEGTRLIVVCYSSHRRHMPLPTRSELFLESGTGPGSRVGCSPLHADGAQRLPPSSERARARAISPPLYRGLRRSSASSRPGRMDRPVPRSDNPASPQTTEHSNVDWSNALAIVGHDIDVKTTYELLLSSQRPPEVFIDAGANFGTHSILFASQGIRTIAFEPNRNAMNTKDRLRVNDRDNGSRLPLAIGTASRTRLSKAKLAGLDRTMLPVPC